MSLLEFFSDGIAYRRSLAFSTRAIQMAIVLLVVCAICVCPSLAYAQELDGDSDTDDVWVEASVDIALENDLAEGGVDEKQDEVKFENVDGETIEQVVSESESGDPGEESVAQPQSPMDPSAEQANTEAEIDSNTSGAAIKADVSAASEVSEERPAEAASAGAEAAAEKEPAAKAAAKKK